MKRKFLIIIGYNLISLILSVLLLNGKINVIISPFFAAFLFAIATNKLNLFYFIFGSFTGCLIADFSLYSFCETTLMFAFLIFLLLPHKKNKWHNLLCFIALILTSAVQFIFFSSSAYAFALCIINLILKMILFYLYRAIIGAIITRGVRTKLAIDEILGLSLLIIPIFISLFGIYLWQVNLGLCVAALLILLTSVVVGSLEAVTLAVIIGLGQSIYTSHILMLAALPLWATSVSIVKRTGKIIMVLALIIVDVILGLYLNIYECYTKFNLTALLIAGLFFIVLPNKKMKNLNLLFSEDGLELSAENLFKMQEEKIYLDIKKMSNLFLEIHNVYNGLVMGGLNKKDAITTIQKNIINKNCFNCVKRYECYDVSHIAEKSIKDFTSLAIDKGRARVIDVPVFLATNCGRANQIMHEINEYVEEYQKFNKDIKKEDEGKLMVSNQLLGVGDILNSFILNSSLGERDIREREQYVIDEFLYNNIIVKECAIFKKGFVLNKIIMVVKYNRLDKNKIINILSQIFKQKVCIKNIIFAQRKGFNIIMAEPTAKYSYLFGSAQVAKNGVCGDAFSRVELDNGKIMVSLSDGKGVGPKAKRISEMTLSLIEKFYKAGYKSSVILDNINRVLTFKGTENFSALDVTVINLIDGTTDFIKRGGTPTIIKRTSKGTAECITSNSLPVGLIENAKSEIITNHLFDGDIVVLSSDGVFDAFNSIDLYKGFINNLNEVDMDRMAKIILNKAIKLNDGAIKDDMTVVCFRLI